MGPADFTYKGDGATSTGENYYKPVSDDFYTLSKDEREKVLEGRTYELKANDKDWLKIDSAAEDWYADDLSVLIAVINKRHPSTVGISRNSDAYRAAVEEIFNARAFLRWAVWNNLMGAWENYWQTPSNFYIYNSGHIGADREYLQRPFFHWIPWDYDNILGIHYPREDRRGDERWQNFWATADIVNWEHSVRVYKSRGDHPLPLITNLLRNDVYRSYYLHYMEYALEKWFRLDYVEPLIEDNWDHIEPSVRLETVGSIAPFDIPYDQIEQNKNDQRAPHTRRQFSYYQVKHHGRYHNKMFQGSNFTMGIKWFVKIRRDHAKGQVAQFFRDSPNLRQVDHGFVADRGY